jgi:hypothetical protein
MAVDARSLHCDCALLGHIALHPLEPPENVIVGWGQTADRCVPGLQVTCTPRTSPRTSRLMTLTPWYSEAELRALLQAAGFHVLRLHYCTIVNTNRATGASMPRVWVNATARKLGATPPAAAATLPDVRGQ